jgi:hypothetical protein
MMDMIGKGKKGTVFPLCFLIQTVGKVPKFKWEIVETEIINLIIQNKHYFGSIVVMVVLYMQYTHIAGKYNISL